MGESLDTDEKSHLAECERCMAEIVRNLDRSARTEPNEVGEVLGSANGALNHARPEAQKALEQGRRVFEREFGISLPEERIRGRQSQILPGGQE